MGINLQEVGLRMRNLKIPIKTRFVSKVFFFQETLEFPIAIHLCYSWWTFRLQVQVTLSFTWAIAKVVTEIFSFMIQQCILN
jgi:hypothetical protein